MSKDNSWFEYKNLYVDFSDRSEEFEFSTENSSSGETAYHYMPIDEAEQLIEFLKLQIEKHENR